MTDWKHWNSSNYAAKCSYCGRDIHTSEGRWRAKREDGTNKNWYACHNCIPPPDQGKDASPPTKPTMTPEIPPSKPGEILSSSTPEPTAEEPVVVPSSTSYTPENRIMKAHDDNMLSYELTRNMISKLTLSIEELTKAMNARTKILEEQLKGG